MHTILQEDALNGTTYSVVFTTSTGQRTIQSHFDSESDAMELVSFLNGGARPSWWNPPHAGQKD